MPHAVVPCVPPAVTGRRGPCCGVPAIIQTHGYFRETAIPQIRGQFPGPQVEPQFSFRFAVGRGSENLVGAFEGWGVSVRDRGMLSCFAKILDQAGSEGHSARTTAGQGRRRARPRRADRKSQVAGGKSQVAGRKSQAAGRKSQAAGRTSHQSRPARPARPSPTRLQSRAPVPRQGRSLGTLHAPRHRAGGNGPGPPQVQRSPSALSPFPIAGSRWAGIQHTLRPGSSHPAIR